MVRGWLISCIAESEDDPFLLMAEEGVKVLVEATTPSSWLVELFPIRELDLVPPFREKSLLSQTQSQIRPVVVPWGEISVFC